MNSIVTNRRLNSPDESSSLLVILGARTNPCLMLFVTGTGSDMLSFSTAVVIIPSWKDLMMATNFCEYPSFDGIAQRFSYQIVSKASSSQEKECID